MGPRRPGSLFALCLALAACTRFGFDAQPDDPHPPLDSDIGVSDQTGDQAGDDLDPARDLLDLRPEPDVYSPTGGTWTAMPTSPISGRYWIEATWSGTELVVWSGIIDSDYGGTNTGARFDPATNSWAAMSTTNAPSKRHSTSHVWSGSELLVFGGAEGLGGVGGGGRYSPINDSWQPISRTDAPSERLYHVALWTGTKMLIWGGFSGAHFDDGALYDPVADKWTATTTVGRLSERCFQSAVWTGSEALIWGGCRGKMGQCPDLLGDGARYDPAANKWTPINTTAAPAPRSNHFAVWTGKEMLVFGGCSSSASTGALNDGFAYNPSLDSWRPLSIDGAPSPRCDGAAAWISGRMVVWGGADDTKGLADGASYDPAADKWFPMTSKDAPAAVQRFAWAASSTTLFVWGGLSPAGRSDEGAAWTP